MVLTSGIMIASGLIGLFACLAWLIWCASRDGAIPDALMLMTGLPIFAYLISQWDNAKHPFFGILLSVAAMVAGAAIKNVHRALDQPVANDADERIGINAPAAIAPQQQQSP
jgi:hypothetical protein